MTDTATLTLRAVTLADGRQADVLLRGPLIDHIGPPSLADVIQSTATRPGAWRRGEPGEPGLTAAAAGAETLDLGGFLLLPAPVEPHAHLDKAFSADRVPNPGGDLLGAVRGWLRYRPAMTSADIRSRALTAVRRYVSHGATTIRTHVDIGDDIGLRALEAICEVRAEVAASCEIQVVAFGASPLSGVDGSRNRALLDEALSAGAGVAGACPGLDPDPAKAIEICLDLAGAHRVPLDLHIDEWLDPAPCTLEILAEAVSGSGFSYGVVASHCVSLGMMTAEQVAPIAAKVARAGISVICLPQTNLFLQGRDYTSAAPRGLTAVKALRQAGVTVAAGGDNVQDPFNCVGRADPLETAALMVLAAHDAPEKAFDSVSVDARRALGLPGLGLRPGAPADLLAIKGGSVREAIANGDANRVVIRAGRVVARTATHQDLADDLMGKGD